MLPNANTENKLKLSIQHAPSVNDHIAFRTTDKDPLWKKIWATRDGFYDKEWDAMNLFKAIFKGASVGFFLGAGIAASFKIFPSFAWKKAQFYIQNTTFGSGKILKDMTLPYIIIGGSIGGTYHLWMNMIWMKHPGDNLFWDLILGNSIYGAGAFLCLVHPGYWWSGMYAGALIGFMQYNFLYGNSFSNTESEGYVFEIPGLTQEEREKQKMKDVIHKLSHIPVVKYGELEEL